MLIAFSTGCNNRASSYKIMKSVEWPGNFCMKMMACSEDGLKLELKK